MTRQTKAVRGAFTLVELLVVIGVVALLISLLLPALSKARRQANTVSCSTKLRGILQAMLTYANDHGGAIPGSGHTTARFLFTNPTAGWLHPAYSDDHCPSVVQTHDWASPLARTMGIAFDDGPSPAQRQARFEALRDRPEFRCPENHFQATPYAGSSLWFAAGPMVSYNTALGFLVTHNTTSTNARSDGVGLTIAWTHWNPPPGYSVRITAIGDATRKIYIADGARYTKNDVGPDADLSYDGYMGGGFADQGASTRFTAAWHRGLAAGNGSSGNDARLCWARHGERSPGAPGGYFRFNAGFFDGHVESLDDLEAANPALWYPKGTRFNATLSQMFPDAFGRYFGGQSQTWTVP